MPVQSFVSEEFLVRKGLSNYWGYNPLAWFAPDARYAVEDPVVEFKTMVRALHDAGLEVVLDVVFNHTAEGNELGPTLSLRGFDNRTVLPALSHQNRAHYKNFTGCGNTVEFRPPGRARAGARLPALLDRPRCGSTASASTSRRRRPRPRRLQPQRAVLRRAALRPGARLREADRRALGRGPGRLPARSLPGRLVGVERPVSRHHARVLARRPRAAGAFAERFAGSSDLFRQHGRKPTASVNFVTSHDGFTLHDLVSYNDRHNEANLENGADGHSHNLSWNCGVEGPTDDPARARTARAAGAQPARHAVPVAGRADAARRRRVRPHAVAATTTPTARTTRSPGSTGALPERNAGLLRFVQQLIDLRRSRLWLRRDTFLKGTRRGPHAKDVTWLHPSGREMTRRRLARLGPARHRRAHERRALARARTTATCSWCSMPTTPGSR